MVLTRFFQGNPGYREWYRKCKANCGLGCSLFTKKCSSLHQMHILHLEDNSSTALALFPVQRFPWIFFLILFLFHLLSFLIFYTLISLFFSIYLYIYSLSLSLSLSLTHTHTHTHTHTRTRTHTRTHTHTQCDFSLLHFSYQVVLFL